MRFRRLSGFNDAYDELTPGDRKRVNKALRLLVENWRHPGLHVKSVRGMPDVWEARASLSLRVTFQLDGDLIILRSVGSHDKTLKDA